MMKRTGSTAGDDFGDNRVPGKGQNKRFRKSLTTVPELDNQLALIGTHFMASNRPFGQARCAARYLVSGKRRNAPDGRFHATGGRVLLPEGSVALRLKCGTLRRKARLALRQSNPGEMSPYHRKVVV